MTIKQHGGIFGRNPTFNHVELTDGLVSDKDGAAPAVLDRASSDGDVVVIQKDGSTVGSIGAYSSRMYIGTGDTGVQFLGAADNIIPIDPSTLTNRGDAIDIGASTVRFKDLYLSGNVVLDSGSGIDFSATAGTGTSELFDDYEEGTWTPTYVTQNSSAITITYDATTHGKYTKVGNAVFITGSLKTDSVSGGSGVVRVDGLPYAASSPNSNIYPIYIGSAGDFAGDHPISGNIVGSSFYPYYRSSVNGGIANLDVSDLGTGADDNSITFAAMYFVS